MFSGPFGTVEMWLEFIFEIKIGYVASEVATDVSIFWS